MKKSIVLLISFVPFTVFAQDNLEWAPFLDYLLSLTTWMTYVLTTLGGLVVIGTTIDQIVPDELDKGFMKKVLNIPLLGSFLNSLKRFSPFNVKDNQKTL